jgi:TonB family protein
MKFSLLFLLVFASAPLFAQQPIYQQFEVDSAAQPRGGMAYLQLFLQTNLRKPIAAQAAGKAIRTTVTGIIEPDGRLTEVEAIPSNSPDADREAVRVFSLFNAWQPAQKGGERVRQSINFPVMFKANEPFEYADGARIDYFDDKHKPVPKESGKARYKQLTPLDSTGLPTGDIVVFDKKADGKETIRVPFVQRLAHQEAWGEAVNLWGYQTSEQTWFGTQYAISMQRKRVSQTLFQDGRPTGQRTVYHANGAVDYQSDEKDKETLSLIAWYPNGQLKQVWTANKNGPLDISNPKTVTVYWTVDGKQQVKDGNGRAQYRNQVRSLRDSTQFVAFEEEGRYENGVKQGIWTGRYSDNSYSFTETFDKGVCLGGKSRPFNGDSTTYTVREMAPEFEGGMQGLGNFLNSNLRYPASAQRDGAQGRVFVSFVVCEDGSLCDYEVLKGVHPAIDEEALRVTKAMSGRWKPGIQRGKKVRVKYNMPINFHL